MKLCRVLKQEHDISWRFSTSKSQQYARNVAVVEDRPDSDVF